MGELGEVVAHDEETVTVITKDGQFRFEVDHVFGTNCRQEEVFSKLRPLVNDFLSGYSITVMTYGQTGSGKTFTMTGKLNRNPLYCYSMKI